MANSDEMVHRLSEPELAEVLAQLKEWSVSIDARARNDLQFTTATMCPKFPCMKELWQSPLSQWALAEMEGKDSYSNIQANMKVFWDEVQCLMDGAHVEFHVFGQKLSTDLILTVPADMAAHWAIFKIGGIARKPTDMSCGRCRCCKNQMAKVFARYQVKPGDTARTIASAHGINIAELRTVNPALDLGCKQRGQSFLTYANASGLSQISDALDGMESAEADKLRKLTGPKAQAQVKAMLENAEKTFAALDMGKYLAMFCYALPQSFTAYMQRTFVVCKPVWRSSPYTHIMQTLATLDVGKYLAMFSYALPQRFTANIQPTFVVCKPVWRSSPYTHITHLLNCRILMCADGVEQRNCSLLGLEDDYDILAATPNRTARGAVWIRVHLQWAMDREFPADAILRPKSHLDCPFCMEHAGQRCTENLMRMVREKAIAEQKVEVLNKFLK